jgi:hypothetical protein
VGWKLAGADSAVERWIDLESVDPTLRDHVINWLLSLQELGPEDVKALRIPVDGDEKRSYMVPETRVMVAFEIDPTDMDLINVYQIGSAGRRRTAW